MPTDPPYRKRLRRREVEGQLRFIMFSCYHRLPLMANPRIMDFVAGTMSDARTGKNGRVFDLYAWVIMPEHAHVLVRPSAGVRWAAIASSIKVSTSKRIIGRWVRLGAPILDRIRLADGSYRFWQHGGGFDRNVTTLGQVRMHVAYIHRNPVEAGLVERAEDWKWSSVRWWMGTREGETACDLLPGKIDWENWKGFV